MKKLFLLPLYLLVAITVQAQYSETRPLYPFENIEYEGYGELHLIQSDSFSIEIDTRKHYQLDNIITEVKGNTLYIYHREACDGNIWNISTRFPRTNIYVHFQQLESLDVSGKVKLFCPDPIRSDDFDLKTSGYVVGHLEMYTQELEIDSEGYLKMEMAGEATELDAEFGGVGKFSALELFTNTSEIEVEGTTTVELYVRDKLDAELSGVSKLYYEGNPPTTKIDRQGLVRVRSCQM